MQPTCYLLSSSARKTILYLGQVSTVECLERLPQSEPVELVEFGATLPDGGWTDRMVLRADTVVSELIDILKQSLDMSIVHFAVDVGATRLSTHDDGEAEITFSSQAAALTFLRRALTPALSGEVIPRLLENCGQYVTKHNGSWKVFDTFDAYLTEIRS